MVHDGSYFDVCVTEMPNHAKTEQDVITERIRGDAPVFVTSPDGETALVNPNADRNGPARDHDDGVAVWGVTDHDHPDGSYTRVRMFGDGEAATVPLGTLVRMAYRRVVDRMF